MVQEKNHLNAGENLLESAVYQEEYKEIEIENFISQLEFR